MKLLRPVLDRQKRGVFAVIEKNMPIRINLMAEAQALEEARRHNPVKQGIWIAGFFVALTGLWIAKLGLDIYFKDNELSTLNKTWDFNETNYHDATNQLALTAAANTKIAALDHLQTNRFLWGNALDALQRTVVDQVVVTHIAGLQTFEHEKNTSIGSGATLKTILGSANLEKVRLSIVGKDYSPSGEGYRNYEDALNHHEYFAKMMGGREGFTIEGAPGPQFPDTPGSSRASRAFTLTNQLPDMRRTDK
jgi:hypothetical protein